MAVVENNEFNVDNSVNRTESLNTDQSKSSNTGAGNLSLRSSDQSNFQMGATNQLQTMNGDEHISIVKQQSHSNGAVHHQKIKGEDELRMNGGDDGGEGFNKEMRDLQEMLSKLNPMAEEFVPPSIVNYRPVIQNSAPHFGYIADGNFVVHTNSPVAPGGNLARRVTEEQLAALFISCGQVVDCRVCGDPNSVLRFAFVEFTDEEGARNALSLEGTKIHFSLLLPRFS